MANRIVITESTDYNPDAVAVYRQLGAVALADLTRSELLASASDASCLVVRLRHEIDEEVLSAFSSLSCVVTPTTGLNHVDMDAAARHGVTVLSLRGETEFLRTIPATAEHTWALLLALQRRIPWALADVCRGEWNRAAFRGRDLCGRTLGIIGLGRVGRLVAGYGLAFGMRVVAHDVAPVEPMEGVERVSLDALLKRSDVVTLHVPLCEETVGLIGRTELRLMKADALLVNTSRGEVIDESALRDALEGDALGGAALDVLAGERGDNTTWLRESAIARYAASHDDLLITPHIGGATLDSMHATELFMAQKYEGFFRGSSPSSQGGRQ